MNNRASHVVRRTVMAAGLVVSALSAAAGYTPVKSITANGSQWVNTGYVPKCTDKIEMKVRFNDQNGTQGIFCSRASGLLDTQTLPAGRRSRRRTTRRRLTISCTCARSGRRSPAAACG